LLFEVFAPVQLIFNVVVLAVISLSLFDFSALIYPTRIHQPFG